MTRRAKDLRVGDTVDGQTVTGVRTKGRYVEYTCSDITSNDPKSAILWISTHPLNIVDGEKQSVITVRLPKSLHDALTDQSHVERTSLNALCVNYLKTRLIEMLDRDAPENQPREL